LTAFILLHISISSLQVVNAAPRPIPIALFDHELIQLEARHDCQNETANATPSSVDFKKQNGLDAQKLNAMFKSMKPTDACQGMLHPSYRPFQSGTVLTTSSHPQTARWLVSTHNLLSAYLPNGL
jgi:hypothetical protein